MRPQAPGTPWNGVPKAEAVDAPAPHAAAQEDQQAALSRETVLALKNSVKLSLSLVGTLGVAFAVRFWLPRQVGPVAFGQLNFADAFALSFFVFTSFGVDTYIRKEVATRFEHANDFFGGMFVLRCLASLVIFAMMAASLFWMGKSALEWRLAFIFAAGQFCFIFNFTIGSLLHAASRVNELAWMNVISKILWGGGIFVGLKTGLSLEVVAVAFFVSEAIKAVYLAWVTQQHLKLRWTVDMKAAMAVLVASFPYYINYLAHRIYEKLNVSMISAMVNDHEVGWYSAALNIATISLLFIPILQAVVLPMASRMANLSRDAMDEMMRGAVRVVLVSGTLISLVLVLHAHDLVPVAFGEDYGPATLSLQILAPMFPLTYLAVLGAMHLLQQERIWTMVKVSLVALVANPLLNGLMIRPGHRLLGDGGAGAAAALASVATEALVTVLTFAVLGRAAVNRQFWSVLVKTIGLCAVVTALHMALDGWGMWRPFVEVPVYCGLGVAVGALPARELQQMLKNARGGRRGRK